MPEITTVREHIAWSYANLARAEAALRDGNSKYTQLHHIIRSRLYKGLCSQTMSMRSLFDDEKIKLSSDKCCVYCGETYKLTLDHLFPRSATEFDNADNLVLACKSCNSSKSDQDMISWLSEKKKFPSIYLLRRWLKNIAFFCDERGLLDMQLMDAMDIRLPFDLAALPHVFPPLPELVLWQRPSRDLSERP